MSDHHNSNAEPRGEVARTERLTDEAYSILSSRWHTQPLTLRLQTTGSGWPPCALCSTNSCAVLIRQRKYLTNRMAKTTDRQAADHPHGVKGGKITTVLASDNRRPMRNLCAPTFYLVILEICAHILNRQINYLLVMSYEEN